MLREPRRLLSSSIAIILGVTFVSAALMLGDALTASTRSTAAGLIRDADYVVQPAELVSAPAVKQLRSLPGVSSVRATGKTGFTASQDGLLNFYIVQNTPELTSTTSLIAGRLPKQTGEAAVSEVIARGQQLKIGSQLPASDPEQGTLTIVGLVRVGTDTAEPSSPLLLVSDAQLLKYSGGYNELYLTSDLDQAQLSAEVSTVSKDLSVQAASEVITQRTAEMLRGANTLTTLLLTFAAVALFTASLVIANTFSILVAQRTKQLSLLRCIGATRRQVFTAVLGEALGLALVASGLGTALGFGLALLVVRLSQDTAMALPPLVASPTSVILPILIGVLVTVLASLVPARRATRIAPLAALRTTAVQEAERPSSRKLITGAVLVGLGVLGLVAASVWQPLRSVSGNEIPLALPVGIAAGLIGFIGILLLSGVIVPALAGLARPLLLRLGVPGELASDNASRNPRRAAATASALLIGVTLIAMMSIGAASAEASLVTQLNSRYPVDATIESEATAQLLPALQDLPEVAKIAVVETGVVTYPEQAGKTELGLVGIDGTDSEATRNPDLTRGLSQDTIVLPTSLGVPAGTSLELSGERGSISLQVVLAGRRGTPPLVTADRLRQLTAAQPMLWLRFTDDADPIAATSAVGKAAAAVVPGIQVDSVAAGRADLRRMLDLVLGVVVGLLAVAVLIAIVGISNTLSLSVLERSHESGLLRALGLSRRELRRAVGLEAVLLSAVATFLGLLLGLGLAIAGTYTILPSSTPVLIAVPWDRLALIGAVAIAAGWLASVLPAFQAARVAPAAALAQD